MNEYFLEFDKIIESEDREKSLKYIKDLLDNQKASVIEVYEQILTPSLNTMKSSDDEQADIWNEHVRTSIVRTIIENSYPYVIKERDEKYGKKNGKTIAVICPINEYHELGARMVTDYFIMLGYEAIFVGSNTPNEVFI